MNTFIFIKENKFYRTSTGNVGVGQPFNILYYAYLQTTSKLARETAIDNKEKNRGGFLTPSHFASEVSIC